MATVEFTCPRCFARRDHSADELTKLVGQHGFGICRTCGAVFKARIDEETGKWSFERLQGSLSMTVHSNLLNQDLTFAEPAMSENDLGRLNSVIKELKNVDKVSKPSTLSVIHGILDPQGAFYRDESGKKIGQWVLNEAIPRLEAIYADYPVQVSTMLNFAGLVQFLNSLTILCPRCGLGIPRARIANCPACKGVIQKTTEDPMAILKLRLAKGEISKEEYAELKKRIET
jgi:hypothetical protein